MKRVLESNQSRLALSPPTRGAWIETLKRHFRQRMTSVAPHAGGVD